MSDAGIGRDDGGSASAEDAGAARGGPDGGADGGTGGGGDGGAEGSVGASCARDQDCSPGACIRELPGGYCTVFSCDTAGCPDGSACYRLSSGNPGEVGPTVCIKSCANASDCRGTEGYSCRPEGVCWVASEPDGGASSGTDGGSGAGRDGGLPVPDGGGVTNAVDRVLRGEADPDAAQAEPQLRALLTATELRYLSYVDWSALRPDLALNDPTLRKAANAVSLSVSAMIRIGGAGVRRQKDRTCDEVRTGLGISFATITASLTANAVTRATCVAAAAASATGLGAALWVPCVAAAVVVSIRAMANLHGWVVRAAFENFESCGSDGQSADARAACSQSCEWIMCTQCPWSPWEGVVVARTECEWSSPYHSYQCVWGGPGETRECLEDCAALGLNCVDTPEPHCGQ